jgi:hypothetical protein
LAFPPTSLRLPAKGTNEEAVLDEEEDPGGTVMPSSRAFSEVVSVAMRISQNPPLQEFDSDDYLGQTEYLGVESGFLIGHGAQIIAL